MSSLCGQGNLLLQVSSHHHLRNGFCALGNVVRDEEAQYMEALKKSTYSGVIVLQISSE